MPTTRPRHAVTETPEVSKALAAAAQRWPEDRDKPARLLRRLVQEGYQSISPEVDTLAEKRLAELRRVSGTYTGLFESGYLERLREDWPE